MDTNLVEADLKDVGGKESEASRGAPASAGDPGRWLELCKQLCWLDCGSGWPGLEGRVPCVSVQVGMPVRPGAQGRGLLRAQPLGEPD